jgi:hypothetical protein
MDAVDVRMRDPLRAAGTNFPAEDFGGGNRLEYTGSAFRMVALQRPVFSPLQDRELAGLTSAQVSVDLTTVSGFGTAGLTCGLDADGSYLFGVVRSAGGVTQVGIAYYDRATGRPEPAGRSGDDDALRSVDLPPVGEPVTVGAVCRPGDGPEEALLTMTLDGREVLSVTGDKGRPEGQVGMFNWGAQGRTEPLVADFSAFAASGSFR